MATLQFTSSLRRHVDVPDADLTGKTVGQVLESYFEEHPQVRSYVLDNQGGLRKHVAIFLNQELIKDRQHLTDPVSGADVIYVAQALSGG